MTAPRVHAVSFLNAAPLVYGLVRGTLRGRARTTLAAPAVCAEALRSGGADAGLVPAFSLAGDARLRLVPGLGVAARGRVDSVLLLTRRPGAGLAGAAAAPLIAVDAASRSSVMLLRVLFALEGFPEPPLDPAAGDAEAMLRAHEAALVIGDPALRALPRVESGEWGAVDLAEAWTARTGLPFVFAVWAVAPGTDFDEVAALAGGSLDEGLAALPALIAEGSEATGLPAARIDRYLRERIAYRHGPEEAAGLARFLDEARRLGTAAASGSSRKAAG